MVISRNAFAFGTLFFALTVSTFAAPLELKTIELSGSKGCDTCEAVFSRAEEALKDPKLVSNTLRLIEDTICDTLPEEGRAKCNATMEQKVPLWLNGIANHWFDPTRDCEDLGLCRKYKLLGESKGTGDLKCEVCTKVIEFLSDDVIQSEKVQDYTIEKLDEACDLLPKSYGQLCGAAVNTSVPEILSYVATFLEANGCSYIGFCNKQLVEVPDLWDEFKSFMKEFEKDYMTANEFLVRLAIFKDNFNYIKEHSSKQLLLKMNKYGDMTPVEFGVHKKAGCYVNFGLQEQTKCVPFVSSLTSVPDSVDWSIKGAVTPVKNQGQCGSCWSFSATGAMEGAYFIKHNTLPSLSEQELVDCSNSFGNHGCEGGLMDSAFEFAIENGMCSEVGDPYKAKDESCGHCSTVAQFSECLDVEPDNEAELMKAVVQQPISVAIEADHQVFMFYESGIINDASCGTSLDHGVLVVGYGQENGQKYWLVKNSWGTTWGDNGYVKIGRDDTKTGPGICGIASQPSFIEA